MEIVCMQTTSTQQYKHYLQIMGFWNNNDDFFFSSSLDILVEDRDIGLVDHSSTVEVMQFGRELGKLVVVAKVVPMLQDLPQAANALAVDSIADRSSSVIAPEVCC